MPATDASEAIREGEARIAEAEALIAKGKAARAAALIPKIEAKSVELRRLELDAR